MLRKYIIPFFAAVAAAAGMMVCGTAATATTVDDVAAVAREYGYSEDMIQQGYNRYYQDPGKYTEADFNEAIEAIRDAGYQLVTTGAYDPNAYTRTTTTTAQTTSATVTTTSNQTGVSGKSTSASSGKTSGTTSTSSGTMTTSSANNGEAPAQEKDPDPDITLTMPDGTTFTRMGIKEFISLSYEDKMAYLRTFTPEQQQVFINNLTPEEYRSLMKQAPTDTKMEVVDKLSNAADAMGMNITIDEISDDSISVAMRDGDTGELLAVANAGVIVEDTGYDRRGTYLLSAVLILGSSAALYMLIRKCFSVNENGADNE